MNSAAPAPEIDASNEPAVARALTRLSDAWMRPTTRATDAFALCIISALSSAAAFSGAVHPRIYGHDVFVMLDAGWRVLCGQRPDVDFSPSMGPTLGLLMAAGLRLAAVGVRAVGYASGLMGLFAGSAGYWLTRRRLPAFPAMLAPVALTLIAVGPFPIGLAPNVLSQAMVYNRYGFALTGLVAIEAFLPTVRRREAVLGGFLSAGVAVAAFFLKPSYGLVACGLLACSLPISPRRSGRLAGMSAGALLTVLALLSYLRFDAHAIYLDLYWMFTAKGSATSLWSVRWAFFKTAAEFLPLGILALLAGSKKSNGTATQPLLLAFLAWICGALLLATNGQSSGLPLDAVFAMVLFSSRDQRRYGTADVAPVLFALLTIVPLLVSHLAGLAFAAIDSTRQPAEAALIDAPHLADFYLYDVEEGTDADRRSNGHVYATYVNDGMALIRLHSSDKETVATLDIQNPFSYTLLRAPAHGGAVALSYHHTFNDQHKPSFNWLFGSTDVVMVPKRPSAAEPDAQALIRNYLPEIRSQFRLCAQSNWWELYKRPSKLAGCTNQP
jgi:hypothetical protein